jgi:hypothetical protein
MRSARKQIADYIENFSQEMKNFIQQRDWIDAHQVFDHVRELLDTCMSLNPEFTLIESLLSRFCYSISSGEVTEELFVHNLNALIDALNAAIGNPKVYLGLNFNPYLYQDLYLYDHQIHGQILAKFTESLKLPKGVKWQ